jgi:DNA-binding NtrC family response regulator
VAHFLDRAGRETGTQYTVSDEALRIMVEYDWPGNIRELEHAIQRGITVASGRLLQLGELSTQLVEYALNLRKTVEPEGRALTSKTRTLGHPGLNGFDGLPSSQILPLAAQEKQAILSTLDTLNGDKLMAAKALGIGKTTLYRKLKEYGIGDRPTSPGGPPGN